ITKENLLLRPANFPAGTPGVGYVTVKTGPHKVAVLNLMGRVFMLPIDCPFRKADEVIPELRKETPIILVDTHCEATCEALAVAAGVARQGLVSRRPGDGGRRPPPPRADCRRARAARRDGLHHRPRPHRTDRRGHRGRPRPDHPALPPPHADP